MQSMQIIALGSGNLISGAVAMLMFSLGTVPLMLDFGTYPKITVYSGIPVKWSINVPEEVINGCNYKMVISTYGITHEFTPGENVIEFTPGESGTVQYTCWMGMINGKINITNAGE